MRSTWHNNYKSGEIMTRQRYVRIDELTENMVIDQPIVDLSGRLLISRKTPLTAKMIQALKDMYLPGVYVREGTEEPILELSEPTEEVREIIARETVSDVSKVELTEKVKKHVSEGIQYLYGNTEAEDFVDISKSISDVLLKAISDNEALAFDINVLKVSDEYTFKHSVDVATIAMMLAKKARMSTQEVHVMGVCGLLHDIGKSRIPNEILNKPGKLTDQEFELMKRHPVLGHDIIKEKTDLSIDILNGVLQHHEKLNGKGYPVGLIARQISRFAKIISVADIYDALVTERPYKSAFSQRDAMEMILSMSGELDVSTLRNFMGTVILYPVGSIVLLSNGEQAKVVSNNSSFPLRPKVVGLQTGKIYNLAEDLSCANIVID